MLLVVSILQVQTPRDVSRCFEHLGNLTIAFTIVVSLLCSLLLVDTLTSSLPSRRHHHCHRRHVVTTVMSPPLSCRHRHHLDCHRRHVVTVVTTEHVFLPILGTPPSSHLSEINSHGPKTLLVKLAPPLAAWLLALLFPY